MNVEPFVNTKIIQTEVFGKTVDAMQFTFSSETDFTDAMREMAISFTRVCDGLEYKASERGALFEYIDYLKERKTVEEDGKVTSFIYVHDMARFMSEFLLIMVIDNAAIETDKAYIAQMSEIIESQNEAMIDDDEEDYYDDKEPESETEDEFGVEIENLSGNAAVSELQDLLR